MAKNIYMALSQSQLRKTRTRQTTRIIGQFNEPFPKFYMSLAKQGDRFTFNDVDPQHGKKFADKY